MRLASGLALGAMSAIALGWGFYAQHGAAQRLPALSIRRPLRSLLLLFSSLRWLTGYLVGIGGWGLYVAALFVAPLSLVQAMSAGTIGVLALMVARSERGRLSRVERTGVAASLAGLSLLGLSLAGTAGRGAHGSPSQVAAWVAGSAIVAAAFAGPLAGRLAAGAGHGVAAGVLYAAGDVATKAAVAGGARLAFVPVVVACHAAAFVQIQLAFQRGRALSTAGVASLLTNALPIAAALALFHEPIPAGVLGAARIVAFISVVAGAALLARPQSQPLPNAASSGEVARA